MRDTWKKCPTSTLELPLYLTRKGKLPFASHKSFRSGRVKSLTRIRAVVALRVNKTEADDSASCPRDLMARKRARCVARLFLKRNKTIMPRETFPRTSTRVQTPNVRSPYFILKEKKGMLPRLPRLATSKTAARTSRTHRPSPP